MIGDVRTFFFGANNRKATVNFKVEFIIESGISYRKNLWVRMQP